MSQRAAAAGGALAIVTCLLLACGASSASAAGCFDEGCDGSYYKAVGCWDAAPKSNTVSWTSAASSTTATVQVYYSYGCGAAFAYLKNFHEQNGWQCGVTLYRSSNGGGTWTGAEWEPVETPWYNFAYTRMTGDAGATEKAAAQPTCTWADGTRVMHLAGPFVREW